MTGWIKLYRKDLEGGCLSNSKRWTVLCYCFLKASYKKCTITVGHQQVTLYPGQFIFGRNEASRELRMKPSTVYRIMKKLQSNHRIDIKSNSKFSIVTIIDWDTYQGTVTQDEQHKGQQENNKRTQTRNKESNNYRESKILGRLAY